MTRWVRIAATAALLAPAVARAQTAPIPLPDVNLPDVPCLPPPDIVGTSALAGPFALVFADGACVDLSGFITGGDKVFTLQAGGISVGGNTIRSITATFNTDPFITFGISTANAGPGPTTYAVVFGTPIVPGIYGSANSSGGVTVSPGQGTASVTTSGIYPTYISGYGTVGAAATNLGVDNGTTTCSATAPASNTCTFGVVTNTFAPTFYDNLEALLTYNQLGASSVASWSGRVELEATFIPEPGTWALLATGLFFVGASGAVRRRKR